MFHTLLRMTHNSVPVTVTGVTHQKSVRKKAREDETTQHFTQESSQHIIVSSHVYNTFLLQMSTAVLEIRWLHGDGDPR